jgi:general secretion pathway protein D
LALALPARAQTSAQPGASEIFRGRAPIITHRRHLPVSNEPADITLNFVNADVKDVAKTILGDYLKLNYEIGAGVQGTVTIQTSQPLTRSQVLPVLEQALRLNDMALVVTNNVYKIVPLSAASKQTGAVRRPGENSAGYGIEVVPVRYMTAAEMAKLLEPLAPTQGIIHVDTAQNVLIVEGTAEERQTIINDVALFDTDTMQGMSFALLTPNYTDAEELTKELNQVMGGLGGTPSGLVRLVPIDRLNAILAISPQPRYLDQLQSWMRRLDKPGQGTDRRIFVYHVQNGRAGDLAATLGKTLLGGSGQQFQSAEPPNVPITAGPRAGENPQSTSAYPPAGVQPPPPEAPGVSVGGGSAMPGVNITADTVNNSLVILATPQQYQTIRNALAELDIAPLQVFLEAAIAEITLNDNLKFGVQYSFSDAHNTVTFTDSSTPIAPEVPGFSYIYTNGASIKIILSTIAEKTHVEVISSPKVLVLNNQPASLQVGDRVPIVTQQAATLITGSASIVNSVQYQDTGVILKVTPRVNAGGLVLMDITQEVSDVIHTTTSNIDSPTIQERKINSSVAVQDGETVALGGLIQDSRSHGRSGIPYLQDIPILGHLFGKTSNEDKRTELMVLITPHVVDNLQKARDITNELRRKMPTVQPLFERGP